MMKMGKHHLGILAIDIIQRHRISIVILLLLPMFSCSTQRNASNPLVIKGFKSKRWRIDSLSCDGKRPLLAKILIENRIKLIGMKKPDLVNLLGNANIIGNKDKSYAYFIERGTQCQNINDKYYTDIQTKMLVVDFDNNNVIDVHIIIP